MNWLKQNWFKIGILVVVAAGTAGTFYWYEFRPTRSYSYCNEQAKERAREVKTLDPAIKVYETVYKACLRDKGIYK